MLLVSQNVENYDITLPKGTVFRINLAWCNSLKELEEKLSKSRDAKFFIDLPIGRVKPPNNKYSLDEMIPIIKSNPNHISPPISQKISSSNFHFNIYLHFFIYL